MMKSRLKTISVFYYLYLLLFLLSLVFFLYEEHGDMVLWLNRLHSAVLNYFFKVWTYTGDGIFFGLVTIALILTRRRFGFVLALVGIVEGVITGLLKQIFFDQTPRPSKYFEGQQVLDLIEGVKVLQFHSFPSGHTATAFAAATFLALMFQKRGIAVLLLCGATLTGVSRMYLNQHFLIDVMAGSLIGIIVATTLFIVLERYLFNHKKFTPDKPNEDLSSMDLNTDSATQEA